VNGGVPRGTGPRARPAGSRRRHRHAVPRPTRRGLGVLTAVVGLLTLTLATATPELVPLVVAVGLPLVVAPVSATARSRRARRTLVLGALVSPPMSSVGAETTLEIRVTNHGARGAVDVGVASPSARWRPWRADAGPLPSPAPSSSSRGIGLVPWVRARMMVPSGLVALPTPGPQTSALATSRAPSARRGVFVLPAVDSWVLDAFGLWGGRGPTVPAVSLVVHPEPDPDAAWSAEPVGDPGDGTPAAAPSHGRDGPGDLVGIRPYAAGDRLTLLHWPARARYGAWFVRQFAPELGAQWRLVLDDRAGVHRKADFERMLSTAEGLIELCGQAGRSIELCTLSGMSSTVAPAPMALEQAQVLLATLLPRPRAAGIDAAEGTVLTTATGARSLPDLVDRIVVGA
jgi:uncharacterized protein (DUF58 family)